MLLRRTRRRAGGFFFNSDQILLLVPVGILDEAGTIILGFVNEREISHDQSVESLMEVSEETIQTTKLFGVLSNRKDYPFSSFPSFSALVTLVISVQGCSSKIGEKRSLFKLSKRKKRVLQRPSKTNNSLKFLGSF